MAEPSTKQPAEVETAVETENETEAVEAASTDSSPDGVHPDQSTSEPEKAKRGRPRKNGASKAQGIELVLTVTGTAEGTDWRAEVAHGSKRVVKGLPIPATAVAAAAKDLHPEIAEAIETVLDAARDRQRSRVEQLRADLEAARLALAELGDDAPD